MGRKERHKRLLFGVGCLLLAIGLAWVLRAAEISPIWRLTLLVPLWGSALGLLQAHYGT